MIQTTAFERITLSQDGDIATIVLANPEKRNALSLGTMRELVAALGAIESNPSVKVVILRALGPAFSAGHDLRELRCARGVTDEETSRLAEIFDVCVQMMTKLQTIAQPVIAEVSGIATAAGCQLVATCDLAIASDDAKFATPGVKTGLFCSTPMVALTRAVGRKRAMEMLLTGEFVDAHTAADWGLINRAVPAAELHEQVMALARKIASVSGATVATGKRTFYAQIERDQAAAYAFAKDVMTENARAEDAQEGIGAFLERRAPVWKH